MFELEFLGWLLIILTLPINICIWFKNYISERNFYIYKKIEIGMFFFVFLYILGLFLIWQSSNGGSYLYLIFILVILTIISTIIFVFPLLGYNLILNIFAITYTSKLSNNEFFHLSIPILTQYNGTNPYLFQNILLIFILTISIFIGSLFYICNLMFDLIEYVENNDACLK